MTTYIYYDPGSPTSHPASIFQITQAADGSWINATPITIDGALLNAPADPDVTVLSNGTYLLAYTTLVQNSGGQPAPGVAIMTAVSTDGINFTDAQPAFTIPSSQEVSDPSVVQLANGSFLMSVGNFSNPIGHQGVSFYISQDGRNYTSTGVTLTQSDISPSLLLLSNGDIRLYTTGPGGIVSFISINDGQTWTQETGLRLAMPANENAGLVSVIQTGASQWSMVFQELINPNGSHTPSNDELTLATSTDGLNFVVTQIGFEQQASSADIIANPAVNVAAVPTVSSLSAVTDTHTNYASTGHTVTVTMTTSEAVTVTGIPTLQLNDNEVATYVSGSGSNTLTFTYTVQSSDNSSDLQVTGLNLPSGAAIADQSGHSLSGNATGDLTIQINTPTVQQEIAGLYVTLYGLAATQAGITYWTNVVSAFDPGITAGNALATAISLNDEVYLGQQMTAGSPVVNGTTYFQTVYPSTMTDMAYVQALYQNMSGFIGTTAGDQYWLAVLQQSEAANGGNVTLAREAIVGQFAHDFYGNNLTVGAAALGVSASDYALLVAGQQTLRNKATVAQYWATETGVSGGAILNFTSVTDPSFAAAQHVLAGITSDPNTVTVAITGIAAAVAQQNLSLV